MAFIQLHRPIYELVVNESVRTVLEQIDICSDSELERVAGSDGEFSLRVVGKGAVSDMLIRSHPHLMEAKVKEVDVETCPYFPPYQLFPGSYHVEEKVCVDGFFKEDFPMAALLGDSGGPLIVVDQSERAVCLYGIISMTAYCEAREMALYGVQFLYQPCIGVGLHSRARYHLDSWQNLRGAMNLEFHTSFVK